MSGPLGVGDRAPEVRLPSHDHVPTALSDYRGAPLVVVFFPLAFTSTCTEELCTFGDDLASYREMGASVVAISVDSPYVLARYRAECGVEFPFLSDFHREAARAFGVLRPEPLGPGLRDTSDRSVFVIDGGGVIRYAWMSKNPGLLPPFEEIRGAVGALR